MKPRSLVLVLAVGALLAPCAPARAQSCPAGSSLPLLSLRFESYQNDAYLIGFNEFINPSSPRKKYRTKIAAGSFSFDLFWSGDGTCSNLRWSETHTLSGRATYDRVTGVLTDTLVGNVQENPCVTLTVTPTSKINGPTSVCSTCWRTPYEQKATAVNSSEFLVDEDTEEDAENRAIPHASVGTSNVAYRTSRSGDFNFGFCRVKYTAVFNVTCPGVYDVIVHYTTKPRTAGATETRHALVTPRRFDTGVQTFEGKIDPKEYDVDYKVVGVEARLPCGADAGTGSIEMGSVKIALGLGRGASAASAGTLLVEAAAISTALYAPDAMIAAVVDSPTSEVMRSSTGSLRQVKVPQTLVDVVVLNPAAYEARFYAPAQVGARDSATRLYAVSGTPLVVYRLENPDAAQGLSTRLRITETRGTASKVSEYAQTAASGEWSLSLGDGLRRESEVTTMVGGDRVKTRTIRDQAGEVVSKVARKYRTFPWGDELIEEVLDPDGAALATTFTYYDAVATSDPNYKRLRQRTDANGGWERFTYTTNGRVAKMIRPFLNAGPATVDEALCRVTETTYDQLPDADGDAVAEARTTTIQRIVGQEIGRRYRIEWSKPVSVGGDVCRRRSDVVATAPGAAWDSPSGLVTETLTWAEGSFLGRDRRVVNPDGTVWLATHVQAADGTLTTTIKSGAPNPARDDIVDGQRTMTVTNPLGQLTSESVSDIASGLQVSGWSATEFDGVGRPTRLDYADGTYTTRAYACCGLAAERDRFGVVTTYAYDALGRHVAITRGGMTSRTVLDADDRVTAVVRVGSNGAEITQETNAYDLAGRPTQTRDALGRLTTYSESFNAGTGHTTRTMTSPDGGTTIEQTARDGSRLSVNGTATAPQTFEYGVDTDGVFTKRIAVGVDGGGQPTATEWVKSHLDFGGRAYRTTFPDGASARSYFNSLGQLVRQVDPDGVTTLYGYNTRGERDTVAVDLNGNGNIDMAGTDRVTRTLGAVASKTEATTTYTVRRTTTQVWETDSQDTSVVVAVSEQSVDGLRMWDTRRGLTTKTEIVLDGSGGRFVITTSPDGSKTTRTFSGERLLSQVTKTAGEVQVSGTTYAHDPHGRPAVVTDARNGATLINYLADDQISTVTTPDPDATRSGPGNDAQTITYAYDVSGRVQSVTAPDGGIVTTSYWPTGAVRRTSGARTYPVEYTYDSQGRLKTLTTWRDFAGDAGRAVTTWNYDASRGWLVNKRHADNTGPNYTYRPSGRLASRTWARTPQVTTVYSYNAAGDLAGTDYSDATPDVALAYDRSGRPRSITDGAGVRQIGYHASGQPEDEVYTAGLLSGCGIDRSIDSLHRLSGIAAYAPQVPGMFGAVYAYDAASRLATVTQGANTMTYTYDGNSAAIASVDFKAGDVTRLTTTKTYDRLNRLVAVRHAMGAPAVAKEYMHAYDAASQRTRISRGDGAYWSYAYDALGQVVAGRKLLAAATGIPGHDYSWTYDDIGNRRTATRNGVASAYTAGVLNQYALRTNPGAIDVLGAANAAANVTVAVNNGAPESTTRQGEAFFRQVTVANSAAAQNVPLTITGVRNLVGPNGEDAVTAMVRTAYVAQTPEAFVHDADGNLTEDARWRYAWDGENRLVTMETGPLAVAAGVARQKLEFAYDGQGRRIVKKVHGWSGGAWVLASQTHVLYDGWNLIAEMNGLSGNAALRTYGWGLDVSGTRHGAGGVGGLLTITDAADGVSHFVIDDGSGNVGGLVQTTDGTMSATYEYHAYGERVRSEGRLAAINPFRFSTKYEDGETGLLYYGYRFLDPVAGRWLGRDPYQEEGGLNLYAFVHNAPTEWIDPLGLALYAFDGTNNDGYRDTENGKETNVFVLANLYRGYVAYSPGVGTNDGLLSPLGMAFGVGGLARIDTMLGKVEEFMQKGDMHADIL